MKSENSLSGPSFQALLEILKNPNLTTPQAEKLVIDRQIIDGWREPKGLERPLHGSLSDPDSQIVTG